ncbi:MAG: hypothetical protein AAB447_03955 [Patescibacteria group bacterium]
METQHPTVVHRSYFALVMFIIVSATIFSCLVNVAWKKKKEKEQVAPITNQKVMPAQQNGSGRNDMPVHRKQVGQGGDAANEAALNKHNLSVSNGGHKLSVK